MCKSTCLHWLLTGSDGLNTSCWKQHNCNIRLQCLPPRIKSWLVNDRWRPTENFQKISQMWEEGQTPNQSSTGVLREEWELVFVLRRWNVFLVSVQRFSLSGSHFIKWVAAGGCHAVACEKWWVLICNIRSLTLAAPSYFVGVERLLQTRRGIKIRCCWLLDAARPICVAFAITAFTKDVEFAVWSVLEPLRLKRSLWKTMWDWEPLLRNMLAPC